MTLPEEAFALREQVRVEEIRNAWERYRELMIRHIKQEPITEPDKMEFLGLISVLERDDGSVVQDYDQLTLYYDFWSDMKSLPDTDPRKVRMRDTLARIRSSNPELFSGFDDGELAYWHSSS